MPFAQLGYSTWIPQVALAEARAAYEMLDKDAKINEQRFQNREKDLMKELNDLKMSSLKDTKRLEAKLDYLARVLYQQILDVLCQQIADKPSERKLT